MVSGGLVHRLFVALRPPPAICQALAITMSGIPGARWQDDEQLHLTVRYIGEVDGSVAEDIAVTLGAIRHPPFSCRLAGVGRFDRRGRTDAVWAGVTPREPLAALFRKVDHALVRIGLPPEGRAYLPHITLARFSRGVDEAAISAWCSDHAALATGDFTVDAMRLFESHLGHVGASYEAVARYSWR